MKTISSHTIEDTYLTELVKVTKFYRLSTKLEMKYIHAFKKHILLANRRFDNSTKKDLFKKAYRGHWFFDCKGGVYESKLRF